MKNRLFAAVCACIISLPAQGICQTAGSAEDVQIRSIDFDNQVLELYNFGADTRTMDGWRFCSHDENVGFRYTSPTGMDGLSLSAGEALLFHWDNDAASANAMNINALGGGWIDDLSANGVGEAISIGLFRSAPFGSADNMIDHIQYSYNGVDVAGANNRGTVAVTAGLWTATDDWVSTSADSASLQLVVDPFPGASGSTHSASSYSVSAVPEPSSAIVMLGLAGIAAFQRRRRS